MTRRYCLIPARSGSKRIPSKNLALIGSTPIIGLTIRNLVESKVFEEVFVSTDSLEIARVSELNGATVPFVRPSALAEDQVPTVAVVHDFIEKCFDREEESIIGCVYSSAALITPRLWTKVMDKFLELELDKYFLIGVTQASHPIDRYFRLGPNGEVILEKPEVFSAPTQSFSSSYHDAGQFYIATSKRWLTSNNIIENSHGYVLKPWEAIDVDYPDDLNMLRILFNAKQLGWF